MRSIYSILILLIMISVADLFAQQKSIQIEWNEAGKIPSSIGVAGPVTGIHNGVLFVGGGANFPDKMPWDGGVKKYYHSVTVFTKTGNQFTPLAIDFKLPSTIAYAANCSTPYGVFYAGGENEYGPTDNVFLLKWDAIAQSVSIHALARLPIAVTNAAAVAIDHHVYVLGGEAKGFVSSRLFVLDLKNPENGWKELAALSQPVSYMVLVASRKKLYVLGGRMKTASGISTIYNTVFSFDVTKNKWASLPSLPYPLCAGTGVAVGKKGVLLFGGDKGTTFSKVEQYLVDINNASDETEKASLIRRKNMLQSEHPGFSREILHYDLSSGKTTSIGLLSYPTPVTTSAFWWDDQIVIPSGEIKAGVRTPYIFIGKM